VLHLLDRHVDLHNFSIDSLLLLRLQELPLAPLACLDVLFRDKLVEGVEVVCCLAVTIEDLCYVLVALELHLTDGVQGVGHLIA